jgi:hypothetical protein
MNQGVTRKNKLWSKKGERVLRELPLKPWASRRREDLFKVKEMLTGQLLCSIKRWKKSRRRMRKRGC